MKKIIILLAICSLFFSCSKWSKFESNFNENIEKSYEDSGYTTVIVNTRKNGTAVTVRLKTIEYDGCEYVITEYDRGYSIAHKGNCKYCNN